MFNENRVKAFFTKKDDGNIAYHVVNKDDYACVDKARIKLEDTYGINIDNLKYMEQVHENSVKIVEPNISYYKSCDGLITDKTNTPLMVMSADCIGVIFYDKVKHVIAVAHAGRNGTFLNISSKVVLSMKEHFYSDPKDLKVLLGPSIQKCCYEVSTEMACIVEKNFGKEFVDGRKIDLQGINKKQLLDEGVKEENIQISKICTKCAGDDYFSYRNDKNCGRFAGIISLL